MLFIFILIRSIKLEPQKQEYNPALQPAALVFIAASSTFFTMPQQSSEALTAHLTLNYLIKNLTQQ